jgi:hypothetical protein
MYLTSDIVVVLDTKSFYLMQIVDGQKFKLIEESIFILDQVNSYFSTVSCFKQNSE